MAGSSGTSIGSGVSFTPDDTVGTVTSIAAGTGITLTPDPIVATGTVALTVPVAANLGGTGVANAAGSTITLGGALSTIGAFTLALTLTAGTALTLPTSGTLATTTNLASYLPLAGGTMVGALGGVIGTVGAPSVFAAGSATTGINFLTGGVTIQEVISGVAVTTVTAALLTIAGNLVITKGTLTASTPISSTQAWNNSGVTFKAFTISVSDPAANAGSASGSLLTEWLCGTAGTTSVASVGKTGVITSAVKFIAPAAGNTAGNSIVEFGSSRLDFYSGAYQMRLTSGNVRIGTDDVASGAVAQTISFQANTGATTTGPLATIAGAGGGSGAGSIGGELRLQGGLSSQAAGQGGAITFYTAPSGAGATAALALTIANTTTATFTGAVAIGNTLNSVSPTAPNRTITMVVGGTTVYLAAKTTND